MTIDTQNLINSIMDSLDSISFVKVEELPGIDLYVDQVTTYMDKLLRNTTRSEEDKILTKTMINNYAKNNLLPSPDKKKYSKEHMLILIFIYYFKNILSINDIQMLLNPLNDKFFNKESGFSVADVYAEVSKLEKYQVENLKKDLLAKYEQASEEFGDIEGEDKEFLQMFSFICSLIFDVYIKKLIIEKMLDDYTAKHKDNMNDNKKKK